jgi:hypothetical protein
VYRGAVAGYSGTPLPKKLGIAEGKRVALIGAPDGFERMLEPLPGGVALLARGVPRATVDVVVLFAKDAAELARSFAKAKARLDPAGGLWVAWPKKASGVATDLNEDVVREVGLAAGLVDNKVCAIDDTWSGLRLVVRVKDRPKKAR